MRRRDLTWQRFTRLTAIAPAGKNDRGRALWSCLCDCGTPRIVPANALVSGNTKSCGCLSRERVAERNKDRAGQPSRTRVDLTGQRFGRLVALRDVGQNARKSRLWECLCDCGDTTTVPTNALTSGNTQSCGCLQKERSIEATKMTNTGKIAHNRGSLFGSRFGSLTVINHRETRQTPGGYSLAYWNCLCDCGRNAVVSASNLRSGEVSSCGCGQSKPSGPESDLIDFLRAIDPDLIANRQLDGTHFRYDAISELHRIVVEFNGVFWHSSAKVEKDYHLKKRQAAESAGYRMITIWQDEWAVNRPRFEYLLSREFGINPPLRIGARKLQVAEINRRIAAAHHDAYHIQGRVSAARHFGLFRGDELISVGSFTERKGELHLVRHTVKEGFSVPGGMNKLVAANRFSGTVVSYVDRDHFSGASYRACGFEHTGSSLRMTYLRGKQRVARETYMRHKLPALGIEVRENDTERSALERINIFQCWNSGIDRWIKQM